MIQRLKEIARTAGGMFSSHRLSSVDEKEGHANFVTNIDQEVEEYLQESLLRLLPGSRIIGEEKENDVLSDDPTWVVDPVDGTTNLIHDYRCSAVSIALCEGKEPVLGMVYQPYSDELFFAEKGKGAFLNDRPIHVADYPFQKALVAFGTAPYDAELRDQSMRIASGFMHSCADIRRSGSAALDLACLACGRHDIFFELRLRPWDYAAGSVLVREAGGVFKLPLVEKASYDLTTAVLAAAPGCLEGAERILKSVICDSEE